MRINHHRARKQERSDTLVPLFVQVKRIVQRCCCCCCAAVLIRERALVALLSTSWLSGWVGLLRVRARLALSLTRLFTVLLKTETLSHFGLTNNLVPSNHHCFQPAERAVQVVCLCACMFFLLRGTSSRTKEERREERSKLVQYALVSTRWQPFVGSVTTFAATRKERHFFAALAFPLSCVLTNVNLTWLIGIIVPDFCSGEWYLSHTFLPSRIVTNAQDTFKWFVHWNSSWGRGEFISFEGHQIR